MKCGTIFVTRLIGGMVNTRDTYIHGVILLQINLRLMDLFSIFGMYFVNG